MLTNSERCTGKISVEHKLKFKNQYIIFNTLKARMMQKLYCIFCDVSVWALGGCRTSDGSSVGGGDSMNTQFPLPLGCATAFLH
jgi:hypothetical protein